MSSRRIGAALCIAYLPSEEARNNSDGSTLSVQSSALASLEEYGNLDSSMQCIAQLDRN